MKFLPIILLSLIPIPVHAITWNEFWEPFDVEPYHYPRYIPMCNRKEYREEYVPGNRWRPGYVRSWYEWVRVPCENLNWRNR